MPNCQNIPPNIPNLPPSNYRKNQTIQSIPICQTIQTSQMGPTCRTRLNNISFIFRLQFLRPYAIYNYIKEIENTSNEKEKNILKSA